MKKENRIKKNEEIAKIVLNKKRVGNEFMTIYYQQSNIFRVAISVSKKFGNAVERNHAKRIVRELIRPNIEKFKTMDLVVVIKNNFKEATFEELNEHMQYFLRKIENRLYVKEEK